ncbi:MAG: ribose-5-phosphate isomerase RpiA [Hyphomicrobiales bacterium]|nr:ribose-5-phosphate isomerase RpiA [Hyphomicrobiales bacterium]
MSQKMKIVAAKEAIKYVKNDMKLGLGTGSTVDEFLKLLSVEVNNGLNILGVVTSEKTKVLSENLRIPLATLSDVKDLDLTIDGADEVDPDLSLIKGGGGALLREKIIAYNSKELIIIADKTKLVSKLGDFMIPVEVSPYEHEATSSRIMQKLDEIGYNGSIKLRQYEGDVFVTDGGNFIYDISIGLVGEPYIIEQLLNSIPGVFENGLFINLTTKVIIGNETVADVIQR